jgi:hypothetical protein
MLFCLYKRIQTIPSHNHHYNNYSYLKFHHESYRVANDPSPFLEKTLKTIMVFGKKKVLKKTSVTMMMVSAKSVDKDDGGPIKVCKDDYHMGGVK